MGFVIGFGHPDAGPRSHQTPTSPAGAHALADVDLRGLAPVGGSLIRYCPDRNAASWRRSGRESRKVLVAGTDPDTRARRSSPRTQEKRPLWSERPKSREETPKEGKADIASLVQRNK